MNHIQNCIDEEMVRNLYNTAKKSWPDNDPWHQETQTKLRQVVEDTLKYICLPETKILNAGAGGTRYNIEGIWYDCDIAERTISNSLHPIIASIEKLPCTDSFFDVSICVGSVVNYCDAAAAISELSRTLKDNGILILEFERSDSAEFLFSKHHHQSAFLKEYSYNGQSHRLWLYSEYYIRNLLRERNLQVKKIVRFHSCSSLLYRFTKREDKSARFIHMDWMASIASYQLAHNAVIICKKISSSCI